MNLKSILNVLNPISHWTTERYSLNNVFDEYENNTLINSNATLGEVGQVNENFSNISINLNNGHLVVNDGSFLQQNIANRNFSIHFNFKVTTEVTGTKPIISKWSPDLQFFIGFENTVLTAKVQTSSGLAEINMPLYEKDIIYSGRWVHVSFVVTPTYIRLYLNGLSYTESLNTSAINPSVNSLFQIGGSGAESFVSDIWVSDISVTQLHTDLVPLLLYKFPRSDNDLWLDLNPDYLYFIADSFATNPTLPIANHGSKTSKFGYLMSENTNSFYMVNYDNGYSEQYVHMGPNSWFTIDDDLDLEFVTDKTSILVDGQVPPGVITSFGSHKYKFNYIDLKNDINDTTNQLVLYDQRKTTTNHALGFIVHDNSDVLIFEQVQVGAPNTGINYDNPGLFKFVISDNSISNVVYPFNGYIDAQSPVTYNYSGYQPSIPHKHNRFWENTNEFGYTYSRLGKLAIVPYDVTDDRSKTINYSRTMLLQHYLQELHSTTLILQFLAFTNQTSPQLRDYTNGTGTMSSSLNDISWDTGVVDALANKQNELTMAIKLNTELSYAIQANSIDTNNVNLNDFTIYYFIKNNNTTTRYEQFAYTANPGSWPTQPGTRKISVFMNSRDGVFSHGDIEFGYDNLAVNYSVSTTSQKFKEDGWHMLAIVRTGTKTELYIDGVVEETIITPTVFNCGTTNTPFRLYGGENLISEFSYFRDYAFSRSEIEFVFRGYSDIVKGKTLLDTVPIQSKLFASRYIDGQVISTDSSDVNGNFEFQLKKDINYSRINLLALPNDPNLTNQVVVHGPYNTNTVYSRFVQEVFEQTLSDMIIDMNPVAFYPLNDVSGVTAQDLSGNALNGTYNGSITYNQDGPDPDSKSILFNGTDAFVDLPDGFQDFSNGLTIEFWFYSNNIQNNSKFVEIASGINNTNSINIQRQTTTNELVGNVNGLSTVVANDVIIESNWRYCVYRVFPDFTNELWVDGQLINTSTGTGLPANILRVENFIGKSSDATDSLFSGYMSNVAIYDYVLPDEDLQKHNYRGHQLSVETLKSVILNDDPVVYWTFDRQKNLEDEIKGINLIQNGSFSISKNALVLNDGVVGNNYLNTLTTSFFVNDASTDQWSIEFGVRVSATQTDAIVVSEWNQSLGNGLFKVELDTSNAFKVYLINNSSFLQSTTLYNDNKWHHIVITYDNITAKLYVDGVLEDSLSISITTYGQYNLAIGNDSTGNSNTHFESEGQIDDLAIYHYVVNSTKINNHYINFENKKGNL